MTECPIPEASVFRIGQHASWRSEGGSVLLYDVGRDVIYDGNRTALLVVERCDGQTTVGEIAAHLATRFGISPQAALADVRDLVEEMTRLALLERLA